MQSVRSAIFLTKYRAECKIITYPRTSIVAQSLTVIRNFARIPESQESARINAFIMSASHPQPPTGGWLSQASPLPAAVSAVCNRKFNTKFKRYKEFMIKFRSQLRIFHLPLSGFIIRLATLCSDSRSIGPSPIRYGHEKGGLPPPFKLNYMFLVEVQSLDNSSEPVITSILEKANSFLPRSLSE